MSAIAAAGVIGLGAGLFGGLMQGSAASKAAKAELAAARENRAFTEGKVNTGWLYELANAIGGEQAIAQLKAFLPPSEREKLFGRPSKSGQISEEEKAELRSVEDQITSLQRSGSMAGPGSQATQQRNRQRMVELQNRKAELMRKAGGDPGVASSVDEAAIRGIKGLTGEYGDLANQAGQQRIGNLAAYDRTTGDLVRGAKGIERYAEQFGQGERARIERDSEKGLRNANKQATAALMGRGLGASSALTDAYGGNAEQFGRMREDAIGSLNDRQLQTGIGLKTGTLGVQSGRATGRDAMDLAGQDTERGLRLGVLNMRQAATRAPNWLGSNTQQFFPGTSPSAAGAATMGSALGGAGSTLFGYGMQGWMQNQGRGGYGGNFNYGPGTVQGGGGSAGGFGTWGNMNYDQINRMKGY